MLLSGLVDAMHNEEIRTHRLWNRDCLCCHIAVLGESGNFPGTRVSLILLGSIAALKLGGHKNLVNLILVHPCIVFISPFSRPHVRNNRRARTVGVCYESW